MENVNYYGFKFFEIMGDIRTRFSDNDDLKNLTKSCLNIKPTYRLVDKLISKIDQSKVITIKELGENNIEAGVKKYISSLNFAEVIEFNFSELANLEELSKEIEVDLKDLSKEKISLEIDTSPTLRINHDESINIVIPFLINIGSVTNLDCYVHIEAKINLYKKLNLQ